MLSLGGRAVKETEAGGEPLRGRKPGGLALAESASGSAEGRWKASGLQEAALHPGQVGLHTSPAHKELQTAVFVQGLLRASGWTLPTA